MSEHHSLAADELELLTWYAAADDEVNIPNVIHALRKRNTLEAHLDADALEEIMHITGCTVIQLHE